MSSSPSSSRLVSIEGMPGAGKTTLANQLAVTGHTVIGEYTTSAGHALDVEQHPVVADDDAHQANWLRKHRQVTCATAATVVLDRDWLTSLAFAYSVDDAELLASRTRWALGHLRQGTLAVADHYVVLHVDPVESLRRRSGRLDHAHPWSRVRALRRLAEFYAAPQSILAGELAARLAAARWINLDAPTRQQAMHAVTSTGQLT